MAAMDYFFWSENLDENVEDAGVIHHEDNKSDHKTIYVILKTKSLEIKEDTTEAVKPKPKPSWKKATNEDKNKYKVNLEEKLAEVLVPESVSQCKDLHC